MDYAPGTMLARRPTGLDVEIAFNPCIFLRVLIELLFAEVRAEVILAVFVCTPELSGILVNYCKTDRVSRHRFTSIL